MNEDTEQIVSLRERIALWVIPIVGALLALNSVAVFATVAERSVFEHEAQAYELPQTKSRWGLVYENDFFAPSSSDKDYTFGLALNYTSSGIVSNVSHRPLALIDKALGFRSIPSRSGFEAGFYGFTPADKTEAGINRSDRPFSSLVYVASSNERIDPIEQSVVRTQLSVGVLGLKLVGQVQEEFHALIGNEEPQGWDSQISKGGEATVRYAISKQRLLSKHSNSFELREMRGASLGYLTEASWGLSLRAGKLNSSWHEFNPDVVAYAESAAAANRGFSERFFWAGAAVKARVYNVFLQGQFSESDHVFDASGLNHVIFELWAGYTQSYKSGYFVSYGLRGHSSEVNEGEADRAVLWGGVMLGKKMI